MKRTLFILAILLVLPIGFACDKNPVKPERSPEVIKVSNSLGIQNAHPILESYPNPFNKRGDQ